MRSPLTAIVLRIGSRAWASRLKHPRPLSPFLRPS